MTDEAFPQAAAVLLEAGWKPHDEWKVYTYQTLVMGFQPDGRAFHVKNWGKDIHGPDYPDDPVEAAHWLVSRFRKQEQIPTHETDSETVPEGRGSGSKVGHDLGKRERDSSDQWPGGISAVTANPGMGIFGAAEGAEPLDVQEPVREEVGDASAEAAPGPVDLGADAITDSGDGSVEDGASGGGGDVLAPSRPEGTGHSDEDIFDADYTDIPADPERLALAPPEEPALEGGDFDQLFLPEPDPADFDPDESRKIAEAVAMFGDNLPMQRLVLIGRVTQLAAEFKSVLQEGWTVAEFSELQNHVMRISQGLAPDDEHVRARFGALSEASRAMNAIDAHAEAQVAYLEAATREQIESYQPEAGWP